MYTSIPRYNPLISIIFQVVGVLAATTHPNHLSVVDVTYR
ncbi:AAA family ATPase [Yersinia pestis]|uniref:AAA family ATPase n=1 Tax=Yersinia pseudotuberculosis TaxID=633 RepID=A0ABN5RCM5_YERPU|nr:AAA family ATPase [Yersinia pseudotuberculosis]AYW85637.1 AAA family ATPase [Yersinia pestis]AYW89725.1 AAA family ATPase [Yersinia pseudotuberculosis]AYW94258.1 AAA family ATPase [Yersinia pseudotuberculosis]AYW98289.1 AAA family ATPase [Yersinia pseudotuberculosis]